MLVPHRVRHAVAAGSRGASRRSDRCRYAPVALPPIGAVGHAVARIRRAPEPVTE
ncbi:hypothetical protein ACFYSJ_18525 [Streptomyces sp. NPDC005248]|uniref:hypothetical protein n=1 Tax=unclassified Streptomyces TaxID=2593676 RepID=UPI0033A65788